MRARVELPAQLGENATQHPMAEPQRPSLPPVLRAFAPLHRTAMGIAWGVLLGGLIFLMTVILLLKGGQPVGPNLALLGQYFPGYTVTWKGSLVGLAWGLGVGFILGWGFALVRNIAVWIWLSFILTRAELEEHGDLLDHL